MRSHELTPPSRAHGRCTIVTSLPSGKHYSLLSRPVSDKMVRGYQMACSGCGFAQKHEQKSLLFSRHSGGCMEKVQLHRWNLTSRVAWLGLTAYARMRELRPGKTRCTRRFVQYALERPKKPSWHFGCDGFPQTKRLASQYGIQCLWQNTDLHDSLPT